MAKHLIINLETPTTDSAPAVEHRKDETVLVRGQATATDEAVRQKQLIEGATRALEEVRAALEPMAQEARHSAEKDGNFVKKVQFQGSECRISFGFGNSFRPLDVAMRERLTTAVGPDVADHLFEVREQVSLRPERADELRTLLKSQGIDPEDYLETSSCLGFSKDYRRKRFDLRSQLSDAQNTSLDTVEEHAASRPSLTTK